MNGIDSQGRGQTAADAPAAYPPCVKAADPCVSPVGRTVGRTVGRISAAHPAKPSPAKPSPAPPRQTGAVLVVALIFLLLLSIVAVSIMRSGQLEVLMAGNSQGQLNAFELAEGVSESVLARWLTNLNPNHVVCGTCKLPGVSCTKTFSPTPSDPAFTCSTVVALAMDNRLNPITSSLSPVQSATVQGRVRPLNNGKPSCVPAFITGVAHGTWAFFFDVEASYDNSTSRQGASRVNHGAVLVNPVSSDCFANPPIGNLDNFAHVPTS